MTTVGRDGGRRVLVTGGASGLGAALMRRFAARGDRVLVTDLSPEPPTLPAGVLYQSLDVRSEADWAAALERVERDWGGLDVLVNNAGVAAGGRIDRLDEAHWERTLDVNLLGVVRGCRTATPLFKRQGSGRLVNVASMAGLIHPAAMGSYTASKAAVVALSETLRHELAPWGIDVSVVCPTFFRTNLGASLAGDDPLVEAMAVKLIERAPLDADEIAARVVSGIDRRRPVILTDRAGRVAFWSKRLARPLYDRKMFVFGRRIHAAEAGAGTGREDGRAHGPQGAAGGTR